MRNKMKKNTHLFAITVFVAISCESTEDINLLVINPLDNQRNDAVIVISADDLSNWTNIPKGKVPVLSFENEDPIACQLADLDGDGQWDELFAVTDLGPSEERTLLLTFVAPEEYPLFDTRTNLRLGANKPGYPELEMAKRLEGVSYHNYAGRTGAAFQMEGPAWENDNVGFRNYLDQRNGMDIFGKLTTEMILDSVGVAGRSSYHEPAIWGMDVLKVGTSLGAGGIGYMYNDSLYRVGDNGSGTYEALFEGSLRSRFLLSFTDWKVEDSPIAVKHNIEIVAGRYCYQSFVTYTDSDLSLDLLPGIVNMKSDSLYLLELNDQFTGLLTHDHQAEDSTLLAMAMIVPTASLKKIGEAKENGEGITQTYYAILEAQPGKPVPYRFYSFWELEDPHWSSTEEIKAYLKTEADRWSHRVYIQPLPGSADE